MTVECGCKLIKHSTVDEIIQKCPFELNNFGCKIHNHKYIFYCTDCKRDLCDECLKEKTEYNNHTGNNFKHEIHKLVDLLVIKNEITNIQKLLTENNNIISQDKDNNELNSKFNKKLFFISKS